MKLNKIISSLLVFVMLFTGIFTVLPVSSFAATATTSVSVKANAALKDSEVKAIVDAYIGYNYSTAEEMLEAELALGYLDSITRGDYKVYVNRYTGLMYYVNGKTGQILTSNPYDVGYRKNISYSVLSQIDIRFMDLASNAEKNYNNIEWVLNGSQISLTAMEDGIRVHYRLGESDDRFFTPMSIMATDFKSHITEPLFNKFEDLIDLYCDDTSVAFDKANNPSLYTADGEGKEYYNLSKVSKYVDTVLADVKDEIGISGTGYSAILELGDAIKTLFNNYIVVDLTEFDNSKYDPADPNDAEKIKDNNEAREKQIKEMPGSVNGPAYKLLNIESVATLRVCHRAIKKYCQNYGKIQVEADEASAGLISDAIKTPKFDLDMEYRIDEGGDLIVTIPTASVSFDTKSYTVTEINALSYFGAGDMNYDGYIFYPDGSGAVVEFDDFYTPDAIKGENVVNNPLYLKSAIYGKDYCYSEITGAHREQIVMPVFGIVNSVKANAETKALTGTDRITNGFFAIVEEGSSLANLLISTGGATSKYAASYASFSPYPMDKYMITGSTDNGYYYVVSKAPYEGLFTTRYTMLSDSATAAAANLEAGEYFDASYVGMAECYRTYLKDAGVITALSALSEDLPLYIEALGSMDILEKILSFPIMVSVPLTTFDDVYTMYQDLAGAKNKLKAKADEYRALAEALTKKEDAVLKREYEAKAAKYDELSNNVQNITNVNFRLTGFANGGMYFTYPTRVNWENSVGGRNGFETLIKNAETNSFGVYPDFDFAYINNTEIFDGISEKGTAACMVDNRYASKQVYNSVAGKYEKLFALVVSPDSYERLFKSFNDQYSKYNWKYLSVSTLGSDLNSNFYKDKALDREDSLNSVVSVLDKMTDSTNSYKLMMDVGNVYTVKYAEHILNATLDSSHFRYSSYAVPFYGMVFHGYVNYAGSPINYSGDADYDLLRAIENGASLYYVLCKQNANYLKEDEELSKYYGVDYENWFEKLLVQYTKLNAEIGDLQTYNIVDHKSILSERVIDTIEEGRNYDNLIAELVAFIDKATFDAIVAKQDAMAADPANIGKGLKVEFSSADIINAAKELINLDTQANVDKFTEALNEVIEEYTEEFSGEGYDAATVEKLIIDPTELVLDSYKSAYNYFTDSVATSGDDYERTEFTCDNGNVVMVTYRNPDPTKGDEVVFLLNYNAFSVEIIIDNTVNPTLEAGETQKITIEPCGYYRIRGEG